MSHAWRASGLWSFLSVSASPRAILQGLRDDDRHERAFEADAVYRFGES